jgi:hypothetical protein
MTPLDRRGFDSLLLSAAASILVPRMARAGTDDPPTPLQTVPVRKPQHLVRALESARPGDHLVLADGTYAGDYALARSGTVGAPILVRAANRHQAVIAGTLTLAGVYTWAHDLAFTGDQFGVLPQADDTTIARCWFTGARGVKVTTQQRVRIGHNRFTGGPVAGLADGHHVYFKIAVGNNVRLPEGCRVYRNYFLSPNGTGADGEFHHILVGDAGGLSNTPSLTDWICEYNLIQDSVRRRGIYTKRGGTIRFNHIIGKARGTTGIRHGGRGSLWGNRFDAVNVCVVNGPDHDVRGNYVRGPSGLRLECEHTSAEGVRYNAADRAFCVGNDAVLTVGYLQPAGTLIRRVDGVQIYDHVGTVRLELETNTLWSQTPAPDLERPTPVTLSPDEVGPDAP